MSRRFCVAVALAACGVVGCRPAREPEPSTTSFPTQRQIEDQIRARTRGTGPAQPPPPQARFAEVPPLPPSHWSLQREELDKLEMWWIDLHSLTITDASGHSIGAEWGGGLYLWLGSPIEGIQLHLSSQDSADVHIFRYQPLVIEFVANQVIGRGKLALSYGSEDSNNFRFTETYEVPSGTRVRWTFGGAQRSDVVLVDTGQHIAPKSRPPGDTDGPEVNVRWRDERDNSFITIHAADPSGVVAVRYAVESSSGGEADAPKPGWGTSYAGEVRVPRNRQLRIAAWDVAGNVATYVATESAARSGTSSP